MEDESSAAEESNAEDTVAVPGEVALTLAIPELTCYLHLLVLIFLLDGDQKEQVCACTECFCVAPFSSLVMLKSTLKRHLT